MYPLMSSNTATVHSYASQCPLMSYGYITSQTKTQLLKEQSPQAMISTPKPK